MTVENGMTTIVPTSISLSWMMRAGRVLPTSSGRVGSKSTSQISPRFGLVKVFSIGTAKLLIVFEVGGFYPF